MHHAAIFGFREKLLYAFIFDRMAQGRRDFRERHQYKAPLTHSRVGNFEFLTVNNARSV
jgi:hypothetical protein